MRRNSRLTNIANGLCGSFASRNNDLDGYWSIGKLCSLADQHDQTMVLLDLLTMSIQPPSAGFAPVLVRYRCLLAKLAKLCRIELDDVTAAYITVDFAPPSWPRASYFKQQWGNQFILTATISTNGSAAGIVRHAGYCRPHDPSRESRSTRWPG